VPRRSLTARPETSARQNGRVLADSEVQRVLVVAAHPDDIDFGAAGTVATWTAAGVDVAYCVATYGDAGGFDDTPREQMPLLREAEQRAAAKVVGVDHYVDITAKSDTKLAALAAHATQVSHRDGLPDGHLAEAFRVVNVPI
jgi:LmbE family N-acetylglucosaminyl deacetylase